MTAEISDDFKERYKKKQQIIRAIAFLAHCSSTHEGPEGSEDYAYSYSLSMRDAYARVPGHPSIQETLKTLAVEKGCDAGMSRDEALKYWTPRFMKVGDIE